MATPGTGKITPEKFIHNCHTQTWKGQFHTKYKGHALVVRSHEDVHTGKHTMSIMNPKDNWKELAEFNIQFGAEDDVEIYAPNIGLLRITHHVNNIGIEFLRR